jgi:hypothetical protein
MDQPRAEKGRIYPPELSRYRDAATGASLWQLTNHPSINHLPYFLSSAFTPDGAALVFTSYRTGNAQLFEVRLPDGEIRQLTDGEPIHAYSPALAPDGESVFFVRGGSVWRLERRSLEERCVFECAGAQLGECTLDTAGEWITAAFKRGAETGLVTGRADGSGWRLIPFPRTVIHPQYHPLDAGWLEFAADPAPRMYRVRRDGTGLECLFEHGPEDWITHETFLGTTGDLVFVRWPRALYRMDWTSRAVRAVTDYKVWHVSPNRAGTKIVCDTNHPDEGLFEIDVATGARRRICLSESSNQGTQWAKDRPATAEDFAAAWGGARTGVLSWLEVPVDTVYGPQWTHPHPCYSPDERRVSFTSDRTGKPQVHVVELEEGL